MIRWTLSEALRGWGYTPVEAETVESALSSFDVEQPSAVLFDINLPSGSGLDVLREIKRRREFMFVVLQVKQLFVGGIP